MSQDHPHYRIIVIGQNTVKSPRDSSERPSAYAGVKKSQIIIIIIIITVIGVRGTVTKGLVQGLEDLEIRGRQETIQTTALLRSVRILRRVLET